MVLSTKDLGAVKLFCVTLKWWMCVVIHLFRPIECPPPRMNPTVNFEYSRWALSDNDVSV